MNEHSSGYASDAKHLRANAPSCRNCEEMGKAWCSDCLINTAKHEAVKALMKADGKATFDDRSNSNE